MVDHFLKSVHFKVASSIDPYTYQNKGVFDSGMFLVWHVVISDMIYDIWVCGHRMLHTSSVFIFLAALFCPLLFWAIEVTFKLALSTQTTTPSASPPFFSLMSCFIYSPQFIHISFPPHIFFCYMQLADYRPVTGFRKSFYHCIFHISHSSCAREVLWNEI